MTFGVPVEGAVHFNISLLRYKRLSSGIQIALSHSELYVWIVCLGVVWAVCTNTDLIAPDHTHRNNWLKICLHNYKERYYTIF